MGSLTHTLCLGSLRGNPREEILNHSFLHTLFDSRVLEIHGVFAAPLAEINRISIGDLTDFPLVTNEGVTSIGDDGEFS